MLNWIKLRNGRYARTLPLRSKGHLSLISSAQQASISSTLNACIITYLTSKPALSIRECYGESASAQCHEPQPSPMKAVPQPALRPDRCRSGAEALIRRVVAVHVAGLLLVTAPWIARAQLDDFNDGNDTSPPPPWIEYNPISTGTWSFPGGNTYRIRSAPSPNPATYGQGRAGSVRPITYTNFYFATDVVGWDDTIHQLVGVLARVGTLGFRTTGGYLFAHDRGNPASPSSGDVSIIRLDHETVVTLATTGLNSVHFDPAGRYRLEFLGLGTNLIGRVYELPNLLVPLAELTATDGKYISGNGGLLVVNNSVETGYNGPADATFDNFLGAVGASNLSDDFNDGNDTFPPPAWVHYDPILTGAWTFPGGNTYRLQSAASPDPSSYRQGRAGSLRPGTYTNFYVAADVVAWDDSLHQMFGVMARIASPGAGTTTGYMFTYDRGNPANPSGGGVHIARLDNEFFVNLPPAGNPSIQLQPGKAYRLTFSGVGENLTGQVYELPNTSVPAVTISTTDPNYPSGCSGLIVANNAVETGYDGPADATFDNFMNTTGEPRLNIDAANSAVKLTWPVIPFTLQVSSDLGAPVWTAVTTGIAQGANQFSYVVPASPTPRFYRLACP